MQAAIDAQFGPTGFSAAGVRGTSPAQFVESSNSGAFTAKAVVDSVTALAFDDSEYPDVPLLYEYHQRDQYFVWRKQASLVDGTPAMNLTIGVDAVLGGAVEKEAVYTDANVTGRTADARWSHSDRDSSRRWGGRRFVAIGSTSSSFQSDAYEAAVRAVETSKHERISFSLLTMREPFLLYPGDLVRVDGGERFGIRSSLYRAQEVSTDLSPAPATRIVFDTSGRLLTDYV